MPIKSPGVIVTMMFATGIWVAAGTVHVTRRNNRQSDLLR
jgi:hypothetical protein